MTNPAHALKPDSCQFCGSGHLFPDKIADDRRVFRCASYWLAFGATGEPSWYRSNQCRQKEIDSLKQALASAGQECVWTQDEELSYPACTSDYPECGWPNKYADCMDFCPHCGRAIQKSAKKTPDAKDDPGANDRENFDYEGERDGEP